MHPKFERKRGGFTLIELLVVIGIIGILASMMLPALASAKDRGKITVCISNLRQISLAVSMYTADHGRFPPSNAYDTNNVYKMTDQTIGGPSPVESHRELWLSETRRPLFSYVAPSQVYRCTADKGMIRSYTIAKPPDHITPKPTAFGTIGCSYHYNTGRHLRFEINPSMYKQKGDGWIAGRSDSSIAEPSKHILLHEPPATVGQGWYQWHFNRGKTYFYDPRFAPKLFISPVAFVDGHVAVHNFTKALTGDPTYPYEPTKDWVWYKPLNP